jgi:hypothetical protein
MAEEDVAIPEADDEDAGYDYGRPLAQLMQAVAYLNKYDPTIAAELYPTLEMLKDHVDDPAPYAPRR